MVHDAIVQCERGVGPSSQEWGSDMYGQGEPVKVCILTHAQSNR